MKQIIFIIVFLLTSVMSINAENIYEGSWCSEDSTLILTFTEDSLYTNTDEPQYTYYIDGNTVNAHRMLIDWEDIWVFNIQQIMMNTIEVVFVDENGMREDIILHKVDNYNYKTQTFTKK